MIVWLLIGGGGVLSVLAMPVARGWVYQWRRAEHVIRVTEAEPVSLYGSMILAEERTFLLPAPGPVEAPLRDGPDWREQTAADLSPEALEDAIERAREMDRLAVATEMGWLPPDSGPGDLSSLDPGPGQDLPGWGVHVFGACLPSCPRCAIERERLAGEPEPFGVTAPPAPGPVHIHEPWDNDDGSQSFGPCQACGVTAPPAPEQAPIREDVQGWAGGCAPSESRPAARADLTGSLSSRHQKDDPGSLAHGKPGLERLGEPEPFGVTAPPAPGWEEGPSGTVTSQQPLAALFPPSRLLKTTGEIMRADTFADVCTFMSRQDISCADWKAANLQEWADLRKWAIA